MLTFFTGDLLVAGIFPIYAEVNTDIFLEAAADLINRGYWSEEFVGEHSHVCVPTQSIWCTPFSTEQGRTFKTQHYFAPSANPQDTIAIYDEIYEQNVVRSSLSCI